MKPVLQVENLTLDFSKDEKNYHALNKLSFCIHKNEMVGIVGESGCGKSLTALSVMGLLPANAIISQGSILFDGKDLTQISDAEKCDIRGKQISMIFQEPMTALNPLLPVGNQIAETLLAHNWANKKEAYEKVLCIMKKVGLPRVEKLYQEYPHQLSGGMRQRIMIAIAIINNPSLLIADEPTTALDVTIQAQILDLIKQLNREYGTSVLLISHDLGVVRELCSRVLIMYSGHIVEEGPVAAVFQQPLHPYTKSLIAAIPSIDKKGGALYTIKGSVLSLYNRSGNGCSFAPRCAVAAKQCFDTMPRMAEVNQQKVMCHLINKEEVVYEREADIG